MGSRLFRTLVGVGISLGVTGTGCLGESNEAAESSGPGPRDGGSGGGGGGSADGPTQATAAGTVSVAVNGSTFGTVGTSGDSNAAGDSDTATTGSVSSGGAVTGTISGSGVGGSGGSSFDVGGSGGEPGVAGQGGDGSDPFCDTTWPTTKGNPSVPECADPYHECEDEYPQRCVIPVGEFTCDGHFQRSYAPLCVAGRWECEPGLVSVTDCKCFAPLPEGHICTEDGILPDGAQP